MAGPSSVTFVDRAPGDRAFMHCNEALGEAAIRAGLRFYTGYPITPHTEIMEYLAHALPDAGGTFVQSEHELAGSNMVYGAAAAGARSMISSSSTGFDLFLEAMSTAAMLELPSVWVNISRGGPGFGNIGPAQGDYHQAVRGGGHGGYRCIVLAPSTAQETVDLTMDAFYLADKWRGPVVILSDAAVAQTKENVVFGSPPDGSELPAKTWALTGARGREPNKLGLAALVDPSGNEKENVRLLEKWNRIEAVETRWEEFETADADVLLVAFGISARVAKRALHDLRAQGRRVGLLQPVTLWPFPSGRIRELGERADLVVTVELNQGQMIDDVRLALDGRAPVELCNRCGGTLISPDEIVTRVDELMAATAPITN